MPINCNGCKKEITSKDVRVCPSCGAIVCDECYNKNGGICEYCSSDMTYLQ